MINKLVKLASEFDAAGKYDIADMFDVRIAQYATSKGWSLATGDQIDRIKQETKKLVKQKQKEKISPKDVSALAFKLFGLSMPEQDSERILSRITGNTRTQIDPDVERVGELVESEFPVEDIILWFNGLFSRQQINNLWRKYLQLYPDTMAKLVSRQDLAYSSPRIESEIPGNIPEDVAKNLIGTESQEAKIHTRIENDLDIAAMDTYRMSQNPQFQLEDGSPNINLIAQLANSSSHRIKRQLERASKIVSGLPTTKNPRSTDEKNVVRELAIEMANEGKKSHEILQTINETIMPGELAWSDNDLWNLFRYRQQGRNLAVPLKRWPDWQTFIQELKTPPEENQEQAEHFAAKRFVRIKMPSLRFAKAEVKGPDIEILKKHRKMLSPEERKKVMDANATWHHGPGGKPSPAIWKSVVNGKTYYCCNTHRAYQSRKSLDAAIKVFHDFIKKTS